jgi:uncharacterized RDD family membrane protein YckC
MNKKTSKLGIFFAGNRLKPGPDLLPAPGFLRRLAAQVYDLFLLIALLFLATALLLPFTAGEAVSAQQTLIYRIYLAVISFFFYGWFWTHGGQTLGLRAWKIKVMTRCYVLQRLSSPGVFSG